MGTDAKYGEVTTSRKQIPAGEPVFILRARDAAALATLLEYHRVCVGLGSPAAHDGAIHEVRQRFGEWQAANRTLVKVPD